MHRQQAVMAFAAEKLFRFPGNSAKLQRGLVVLPKRVEKPTHTVTVGTALL